MAANHRRRGSLDLTKTLGASRVFPIRTKPDSPFGAMALLEEVRSRLVSRGGRPADPAPTIRRLVPVRRRVWENLRRQASLLSGQGRPVSPGQLAAILLEKSIARFESEARKVR